MNLSTSRLVIIALSTICIFSHGGCGDWNGFEPVNTIFYPGSATLSWQPPTTNIDGTPANDISGFIIYYGQSSRNYTNWVDVKKISTYTINNLQRGTYYFAITSYDLAGNESDLSNEMSKIID